MLKAKCWHVIGFVIAWLASEALMLGVILLWSLQRLFKLTSWLYQKSLNPLKVGECPDS